MAIPHQMEIKILPFRLNGRIGYKILRFYLEFKGLCLLFQMKYAAGASMGPLEP
jgi:hypothetical protein